MPLNLRQSPVVWRLMKRVSRRMVRTYGTGNLFENIGLVLTTTGRKTGLPRRTPLQYEEIDGEYWVGSARGLYADWVCNLQVNPAVVLQVRDRQFAGTASVVTDTEAIVGFLETRIARHPRMIRRMLRLEGLPRNPSRADLEALAARIVVVRVIPVSEMGMQ